MLGLFYPLAQNFVNLFDCLLIFPVCEWRFTEGFVVCFKKIIFAIKHVNTFDLN